MGFKEFTEVGFSVNDFYIFGLMINTPGYKRLYSTSLLQAGQVYEEIYITNIITGRHEHIESMYGNPACAVISADNKWAVIAGGTILIWIPYSIKEIINAELANVHSIRIKDNTSIEMLIDPWADNAAIWQLDVVTQERNKMMDFTAYKNKEYTDNILW